MIDLKSINISDLKNLKPDQIIDKVKEFLLDEQKKMFLILGVTFVLAALFLTFLVIPKFTQLSRASRSVADLNYKINLVNSRVRRLDEMKKKLDSLRAEQARYAGQLPAQKEIPELLNGFASIAKKSNVKILSITPYEFGAEKSKPEKGVYYQDMPIVITAKSGYHQLGHFVNNLEQGKRFITIEDLRIQYDAKFPRRHSVRMVLKTYVSVEDEKKK